MNGSGVEEMAWECGLYENTVAVASTMSRSFAFLITVVFRAMALA